MNKEQIYDKEINPLMAKIIKICQTNKIAMVCSFDTPNGEDDDLRCTSALLTDEFEPPKGFIEAKNILIEEPFVSCIIIKKK